MMRAGQWTLALAAALPATAAATSYPLPAEPRLSLPPGPNRDLAGICAACHSLDYIQTQPRGKGAQFWRDSVTKMVNVYKAPIDPADADKIAAYLGDVYGQPSSGSGTAR